MPLPEPQFDTRRYREIITEALARIPVHNPEWTNQIDSDPGVTLLQLFAFMAESVIYRANRIPERNRMKFLRLLGVGLRAAQPAKGLVTFSNPRGALEALTLAEDQELLAGGVPFRTVDGIDVLPIEARLYYKSPLSEARRAEVEELYRRLYASFETAQQSLDFYETKSFETPAAGVTLPSIDLAADTLDGAVWLALLARAGDDLDAARQAIANRVLSLGVVPALDADGCALYPLGPSPSEGRSSLTFELPATGRATVSYTPLPASFDGDPLAAPSVVALELPGADKLTYWSDLEPLEAGTGAYPPALEESDDGERLLTWIRIRSRQLDAAAGTASQQLKVSLSWVGINASAVVQRARVTAEQLPAGTGEPDQSATLVKTPVLPGTLTLNVNGERWSEIDDLAAAPAEVPPKSPRLTGAVGGEDADPQSRVYAIDLESGEIRFGDGAHGMRPPKGASLEAAYCWGGGSEGLVAVAAISRGPLLPSGIKVTNPIPTWGGAAAETVAEGERRVPAYLRHRDRLVSASDFEEIARATPGVEIGRVEVLPLFHPDLPAQASEGVVTVLVIPAHDAETPRTPTPDRLFLETVCEHLEPRRLLTTELHVRGPSYRSVWVSVGIEVVPGRDEPPVREAVTGELQDFLSPLIGGFDGGGWPLERAVEALELWAAATRVDGVAKVNGLLLAGPSGAAADRVEMRGLELPRLEAVAVESGDPMPLDELRGEAEATSPGAGGIDVVPVPVVPEEC